MAAILVVEESPLDRSLLTALLRDQGHRVLGVADEEEALEIVRAEQPDIVLVDLLATSLDGRRFVAKMRENRHLVPPKMVFLAAPYLEAEGRAAARAFGVDLIVKPVDLESLLAVVDAPRVEPSPREDPVRGPGSDDSSPASVARPLQGRVMELEGLNAQMEQRLAEQRAQLEVARSALDREIEKRLWAEHELTQANLRLSDQAIRDGLTGLYNRRYLEVSLVREESRARRTGQPFGVGMIDIDNFKLFNDQVGHAAGDAVLKATARYIASAARGEDIVSRYGGDEFVLVMSQASRDTLFDRAETLRSGVSSLEIVYEGRQIGPVTLSVGIGIFPDHGKNGQAVLRVADKALYLAKGAGRNRIVMGTPMEA